MARKSDYTPEIAAAICERIASGESLISIGKDETMPSERSVYRWLADPDNEAFRQEYARARESQAEAYLDQIIEIADNCTDDVTMIATGDDDDDEKPVIKHSAIQRARLQVDTRKWAMSKLAPKKYGDKLALGGDAENPIKTDNTVRVILVDPDGC